MDEASILDKVLSSKQVSDIQNFNPAETLAQLFRELTPKEEETIRARFGLGDKPRQTLEEIGKRYAVTRERVRQIQDTAIKKMRASKKFRELAHTPEELIRQMLEAHGGAMTEERLLQELFRDAPPQESERRAVLFLLNELLADRFDRIGRLQQLRDGWKLKTVSVESLHDALAQIEQALVAHGKAVKAEALFLRIRRMPYFQEHPERQHDDVLFSYLSLAQRIGRNPYQEYGLMEWGTIAPKRMNDKIYLILQKHGKPLHFTDITRLINETGFDHRKAYPPTVHNELILNKEYVLVGRGMYALREWGYKPGVVADVLEEILRGSAEPLSREELVRRVLEQRMVKKNTIHLALADHAKFEKLPDGRYRLLQGTPQAPSPATPPTTS